MFVLCDHFGRGNTSLPLQRYHTDVRTRNSQDIISFTEVEKASCAFVILIGLVNIVSVVISTVSGP
jgi:hypothetical protein